MQRFLEDVCNGKIFELKYIPWMLQWKAEVLGNMVYHVGRLDSAYLLVFYLLFHFVGANIYFFTGSHQMFNRVVWNTEYNICLLKNTNW